MKGVGLGIIVDGMELSDGERIRERGDQQNLPAPKRQQDGEWRWEIQRRNAGKTM